MFAGYFGQIYAHSSRVKWPKVPIDSLIADIDAILLEDASYAGLLLVRAHLNELRKRPLAADRDLADLDALVAADQRNVVYSHLAQLGRVMVYAAGRPERASEVLRAIPALTGKNQIERQAVGAWLYADPVLDGVRDDPAFRAFAERYETD